MERVMSAEERIRRAEDIYYRRKMQSGYRSPARDSARVSLPGRPNFNILKKMFVQLAICSLIYLGVHVMQVTENVVVQDALNRVRYILSYNTDFNWWYAEINDGINRLFISDDDENENGYGEEGVGGGIPDIPEDEAYPDTYEEEIVPGVIIDAIDSYEELTQMELDARYVLENHILTIPLRGTITSRFGYRDYVLPRFHTGIDIAANTGTVIVAAMEGYVTLVSNVRRLSENILK